MCVRPPNEACRILEWHLYPPQPLPGAGADTSPLPGLESSKPTSLPATPRGVRYGVTVQDELVGALTKSAKGGEGDRLEVDVQALLLDDVVRATILVGSEPPNWLLDPHTQSGGRNFLH